MNTLGDRIRFKMKVLGLTQAKLGERVGLSQVAIGNIINGKTKDTNKILQIANELRVNPQWLLDGSGDANDMGVKDSVPLMLSEKEWTQYTPKARQFIDEVLYLLKNKKIDDEEISALHKMTSCLSGRHHAHA